MLEFSGIMYLDTEKITDCGEDAMTFGFDESGNGYMFVFDGCGGAGSQKHAELDNRKSAYIASRSCALFLDHYLGKSVIHSEKGLESFSEQMFLYLNRINDSFPMETTVSTLVDVLPTTISGIIISNDDNCLRGNYIWSGDSRGYIIDINGISQVTEDDVNSEDAFTNITDDSIMNNRIHGNKHKDMYLLHSAVLEMKDKCILICATDGCYDYFNSPMVFEYLILSIIIANNTFAEAEAHLNQILKERAGDDYSIILAFYGFEDFDSIKAYFHERYQTLDKDKEFFGGLHGKTYWETQYKNNYYRFNPLRRDADGRA